MGEGALLTPELSRPEVRHLEELREETVRQLAAHQLPAKQAVRRLVAVQHGLHALRARAAELLPTAG
ncbi:hypothetical protein [Streptomyces sp. NPDC005408]|uniref:hypothetical protein n=1 Tax=Streptomyces sp. NPDC005408 TaxID=3155341 RepID=UPI0033BACA40